jgi:hypothetical protein
MQEQYETVESACDPPALIRSPLSFQHTFSGACLGWRLDRLPQNSLGFGAEAVQLFLLRLR